MGPNCFDVLAMRHPDTPHKGKVIVELTGFPMSDQVKLGDCKAEGVKRTEFDILRSCVL